MRDPEYTLVSRVGRGNVDRVSPIAVTSTGSIVSCAVKAGDIVQRGQVLFETVNGTFDGTAPVSTEILAGVDGVVASLQAEQGGNISKDSLVAKIYPDGAVRVTSSVSEADLKTISVGQKVQVELDWNEETGISYEGTVTMISALGEKGDDSTFYPVYVSFTPDEGTRYHMTALVSTLEDETPSDGEAQPEKSAEEDSPRREDETPSDGETQQPEETGEEYRPRRENEARSDGETHQPEETGGGTARGENEGPSAGGPKPGKPGRNTRGEGINGRIRKNGLELCRRGSASGRFFDGSRDIWGLPDRMERENRLG